MYIRPLRIRSTNRPKDTRHRRRDMDNLQHGVDPRHEGVPEDRGLPLVWLERFEVHVD